MLCGCGAGEDPYRVDTVVRIPVNPTEAAAQPAETEAAAPETETDPEVLTEAPTGAAEDPTEETKKFSGSRRSSSGKSSTKETQPPETEVPATEVPETETPHTEPAATGEDQTGPAGTEPDVSEISETQTPTEPVLYDISGYAAGSLEYALAEEINAARSAEGLPALGMDSRLSAIASCRAFEISQVWSHTRPDGRDYATVLEDYGYGAGGVTELLVYATGDGDAAAMAEKWLSSDSHHRSLMGGWSAMGIGVFRANGYTYVCCLLVQ